MDLICATLRFMFVWVFFVCVAFFFFFLLKNETCLSSHAECGSRKRLIALSSSTLKTNTKHWGKQGCADLSYTQKPRAKFFLDV